MTKHRMPSHATVVAYLALFIAVGAGGAWAADKITSKQIARDAVRSKHIKKNQVLARHIKRSQVNTKHLVNQAVTAKKLLDGPGSRVDADTLDGIGSGGFLASNRVLYGRGVSDADGALVLRWPGAGVEVRTHDAGEGDSIFHQRLLNTNPPGGSSFWVKDGTTASSLTPGSSLRVGTLTGTSLLLVENKGNLGRMMRLDCFANVIVSGDDHFIQCMGLTAGA